MTTSNLLYRSFSTPLRALTYKVQVPAAFWVTLSSVHGIPAHEAATQLARAKG